MTDELIDVLDEHGKRTGRTKLKSEVHRDGDWHTGAHVWIINNKAELLLQKRSAIKDSHPNQWDISSAGHSAVGEETSVTAVRELHEELGIDVQPQDLELLFTTTQQAVLNNGTFINNEYNDSYLLKKELDISRLTLQDEEVAEVKWIHFTELEKLVGDQDPSVVPHDNEYRELFKVLHKKFSVTP